MSISHGTLSVNVWIWSAFSILDFSVSRVEVLREPCRRIMRKERFRWCYGTVLYVEFRWTSKRQKYQSLSVVFPSLFPFFFPSWALRGRRLRIDRRYISCGRRASATIAKLTGIVQGAALNGDYAMTTPCCSLILPSIYLHNLKYFYFKFYTDRAQV